MSVVYGIVAKTHVLWFLTVKYATYRRWHHAGLILKLHRSVVSSFSHIKQDISQSYKDRTNNTQWTWDRDRCHPLEHDTSIFIHHLFFPLSHYYGWPYKEGMQITLALWSLLQRCVHKVLMEAQICDGSYLTASLFVMWSGKINRYVAKGETAK